MAGYLGATPVPQATQHRESFTATSGQTTFATAGYTAGFVDVYLNGSHLSPADFTATNGSDVVLASGASADDVCDIISHSAFEVNAQVFTGDFTVDGTTLVVDSTNNRVGIGTNSPAYTLDVSSTVQIRAGDSLRLQNAAGNAVATINCDGAGSNSDLKFTTAGAEVMRIDNTGAVTKPLQPAFLVHPASAQNNIALNSPVVIVLATEIFDNNADFNNTNAANKFTAPVTGKYQFNVNVRLDSVDTAANFYELQLSTSNRTYQAIIDPGQFNGDLDYFSLSISALADMDASDTAAIKILQSAGTAQTDIDGGAANTNWSGYLVA